MEKVTAHRKKFIINFCYFGIIIALFYFLVNYAFGYLFPFLFAGALAIMLQPPVRAISKKLKLKAHGIVSMFLVLFIVTIVVCAIVALFSALGREIKELISHILTEFKSIDDFINVAKDFVNNILLKLPKGVGASATQYVEKFFSNLSSGETSTGFDVSALSAPLSGAWSVVKGIPSAIISVVVTIISCVFMTSEYDIIRDLILKLCSKERGQKIIETKRTVTRGIGKLVKAYITIMLITFTEVFLGLNLMRLIGVYDGGYIAIIAFVTCIVDIVPVLGTGTVMIPWAIYSIVSGNVGLGIGLIILYAVITVLRQAIEPKLVANQVGLPSIVTIMAMFLGGRVFGAFGVVLLPLTVIVVKMMLDEGIIGAHLGKSETEEATVTAKETEVKDV